MKQITKKPVQFIFTKDETTEILKFLLPQAEASDIDFFVKNFLISNNVILNESDFELLNSNWWLGCNELEVEGYIISEKEFVMNEPLAL